MNPDFVPPAYPWPLFSEWYTLACQQETTYPDCMILATVGEDYMPSARAVLMKAYDEDGLVFFSNRQSHKGQDLSHNPQAAACFYWKSIGRQIRVQGDVVLCSEAESDAYFKSRPYGSQIGAWASLQSRPLEKRAVLEARVRDFSEKYSEQSVPRPAHWGGYRLVPRTIEFWQEKEFRLHDRFVYRREGEGWAQERLYP